jgi:hypothetical protein
MKRRDFLKGMTGVLLAVGWVARLSGAPASASGQPANGVAARFRGSSDGRIYELSRDGVTWQPRANFGKQCAITEVSERDGKVVARIAVQGHPFVVQSADGRVWHTLDWVAQKV